MIAFCTLLMGFWFLNWLATPPDATANRQLTPADLVTVSGTLACDIQEDREDSWAIIKLKEYEGIDFRVSGNYPKFWSGRFQQTTQPGDTVAIDILRYNYETTIAGTRKMGKLERLMHSTQIEPYGISANGNKYLLLDDINLDHRSDGILGNFMGVAIGICIAIYAILHFSGALEKFSNWINELQKGM